LQSRTGESGGNNEAKLLPVFSISTRARSTGRDSLPPIPIPTFIQVTARKTLYSWISNRGDFYFISRWTEERREKREERREKREERRETSSNSFLRALLVRSLELNLKLLRGGSSTVHSADRSFALYSLFFPNLSKCVTYSISLPASYNHSPPTKPAGKTAIVSIFITSKKTSRLSSTTRSTNIYSISNYFYPLIRQPIFLGYHPTRSQYTPKSF
jgi:hypothetical protein